MRAVNQAGQKTLKKLAEMATVNGGHVKVDNRPGFMPVVVEHVGDRVLSVAHYYEQCGDLMADPVSAHSRDCKNKAGSNPGIKGAKKWAIHTTNLDISPVLIAEQG